MISRTQIDVDILQSIKIIKNNNVAGRCSTWGLVDSKNWLGPADGRGKMDDGGGRIIS